MLTRKTLISALVLTLPYAMVHAESDQERLLKDLDSKTPAVRAAAARQLKPYVQKSQYVFEELVASLKHDKDDAVRIAAAKSAALPPGAGFGAWGEGQKRILLVASDSATPDAVRAAAYQALWAADDYYDTALRGTLLDEKKPSEVRKGAAFALFWSRAPSAKNDEALMSVARDVYKDADIPLRVEAIKSLYGRMAKSDWVRRTIQQLADPNSPYGRSKKEHPEEVRVAATLCHAAIAKGADGWLRQVTASSHFPPAVKAAAAEALGGENSRIARYFHLAEFEGKPRDPLEEDL